MLVKGDKKIIRGWVFYDWANSVYNLVISSAIFPIFYENVSTSRFLEKHNLQELPEGMQVTVDFFGHEFSSSVLISYVLSASFLVVSVLSPMLSGVADLTGNKKRFMQFFCYLGAISCMSLYFFKDVPYEVGMLSIFLGSIGFWNSLVFYNAFLPEIAEPEDHDKISARGFSMGYFGSMILLVICLLIIMKIDPKYTSLSFLLVGIWWISFSQFTFRVLPVNVHNRPKQKGVLLNGFKELRNVLKEFLKTRRLKRYLLSFFFFNTGIQTVMLMAVYFAKKEIDWPSDGGDSGLIIAILLIQILGAVGAFIMSRLSSKIGNIYTLMISVSIWIGICVVAYFIHTPVEFYGLAAAVGLVMGGVQAVGRSTYSKFLPETQDHASYFSFYDVTEKIGIVIGTFSFGLMEVLFGSIRYSISAVAFFFVIGMIALFFVPKKEVDSVVSTS
ncbi:MAG: MFS transporter [Bacteroidetes bacterium]|nr:MAG: MFS transporter [Bacteroidota bacterium]